jgi:hypothetical protein
MRWSWFEIVSRLSPFYPALTVFFGAIVVALGGFWAAWRQSNFNSDIRQKNEEIARLQRENTSAITGGDSFCWMAFQMLTIDGNMPNAYSMPEDLLLAPFFAHVGKYPLYDVTARIVDTDLLPTNIQAAQSNGIVGNMTPGFGMTSTTRIRHHGKDFNFNVFYVARNGSWIQHLRMRWVGDGWATASKVLRGKEVLYREVSANFPRTENGTVDWGDAAAQDTK